jgi:HAD superfamily hydrolase (TIGR01490 family)|tara:strand:+ start:517 stop:1173 length:657 start_codon:yes stop_codon:yes gene_type:complete
MGLALFDLDNTLIAGDSDHLWGDFLVSQGRVDAIEHKALNAHFYDQYKNGELNIDEYLAFALGPMAGMTKETLAPLQRQFVRDHIEPILLDAAFALLEQHRALGDTLVIITATNTLVTQPIADRLGVEHLIGCEAEIIEGCYTGKPTGMPSFAQGKVARIQTWCEENKKSMENAVFYSDSHNDLPLLRTVDRAVAVDPDDRLREEAVRKGWDIISLRG